MTEPTEIRELDEATVERIAAGEVVERPASVVKELVENSLDAGASRVRVAVEAGGTDGIRVSDDGVGMTESQARTAVREHTTSKISDIDDLESGVGTLGFRGEALHAIGAVSRLTITTRPRGGDRGTRLRVEGGEVTAVESAGCPEGTTVDVDDLFYNVPARRKYLSRDATEFDHVSSVVTKYALANPDVAVELEHDGRETFATSGQGSLQETVMAVYGREVAESMIDVETESLPDGPLTDVSGLVSHPETNRAGREYLSTFVNGRYVRSGAARDAVLAAYDNQLAADRYPFAVIHLAVPADTVDVNVHPRKMEVRWTEPEALERQIRSAIEDALREEGILRSTAPRGRSAPEQTTIEPSSTTDTTEAFRTGETDQVATEDVTSDDMTAEDVTVEEIPGEETTPDDVEAGGSSSDNFEQTRSRPPSQSDRTPSAGSISRDESTQSPTKSDVRDESAQSSTGSDSPDDSTHSAKGSTEQDSSRSRSATGQDPDTQTTLHGNDAMPTTEYDAIPDLRILGQLHDTYVVAEADDGLVLIDQHAADERINYERLKDRFEGDTTTQVLADPVELELTSGESAIFDAYREALARIGFTADRTGDRTVRVSTVPAFVAEATGPKLIRDVLADLVADGRTAEETVEAVVDDLLADMACHPSITGNTSLTEGSIVDLLSALDECENPWACPHGRPVLIHVDSDEIDDRFERDYPGGH
ncbi:DNA mismatch repair endonuclease MutL [Halorhabdus rudnickae]|uniref:DNA mismatch repair endonuclease MutL n=1 Tax=Halorhabdus rudnickae TaxID=1775544 RepID=UPI0010826EA0|nr:DNA mismatch repair endonuclease MutL [Halorhabdus rudnickae]